MSYKRTMNRALKCIKNHCNMNAGNVEYIGLTVSQLREDIGKCDNQKPIMVTEEMTNAFYSALSDHNVSQDELNETIRGLENVMNIINKQLDLSPKKHSKEI